jgi:hypothetical protein
VKFKFILNCFIILGQSPVHSHSAGSDWHVLLHSYVEIGFSMKFLSMASPQTHSASHETNLIRIHVCADTLNGRVCVSVLASVWHISGTVQNGILFINFVNGLCYVVFTHGSYCGIPILWAVSYDPSYLAYDWWKWFLL